MARRETPFELWAAQEGVPVVRGYGIEDLRRVSLAPWPRKGGEGAIIALEGGEGWISAYLCRIPGGASLLPERHLFEEQIFILEGKGETEIWYEGGARRAVQWSAGSLFSPPLNSWHRHRSAGGEPALFLAVTNAPLVFNVFRSPSFVFDSPCAFPERYNGQPDYFTPGIPRDDDVVTNFVPDVFGQGLYARSERGTGFSRMEFHLAGNSLVGHIAEFAVGTYKKGHRHTAGAHILILTGKGYSLMWLPGGEKIRVDWKPGSVFSPPEGWFHQHFNTAPEPARCLALRRGMYGVGKQYKPSTSMREGGDMIDYEDEDPDIRELYARELAGEGIKMQLAPVSPR